VPYRSAAPRDPPPPRDDRDRDLVPVLVVVWLGAVGGVIGFALRGTLGTTAGALALACSVALPWLLRDSLGRSRRA